MSKKAADNQLIPSLSICPTLRSSSMTLWISRSYKSGFIKLNPDKTAPILSTTSSNKAKEPTELSISTHNIEKAPSYNALSYIWGLPEPSPAVLINGGLFRIRENLWEFLRSYITQDWSSTPNRV